jgi:BASS family bile acid:Na+ symporter
VDIKQLIVLALQIAIIGTVFGFGLRSTIDDVLYVWRHPSLLIRSLLAVLVIMPVLVIAYIKAVDLRLDIRVVLMALALSPVPPLLPNKVTKAGGSASFGLGLLLVLAVGAIAAIPISVAALNLVTQQPVAVEPGGIARIVVMTVLVPLLVGMTLHRLAPRAAAALETPVRWIATGLLLVGTAMLLFGIRHAIWAAIGGGAIAAIVAFVAVGLVVGHLMGGPEPENATALALATACRHPAIALSVASANFPDERFGGMVVLYLLVSAIAAVPYVKWQGRRASVAVAT